MKIPSSPELRESLDDEGDGWPGGSAGDGGTVTKPVELEKVEEEESEEEILREVMA